MNGSDSRPLLSGENARKEYIRRINLVLDYIEGHLDGDLSLTKLASVAAFSPFHFHRLFALFIGEPLNRYIGRIRLERAANRLTCDAETSVTSVALNCGYSGSSAFARAFKAHFGVSPREWRARKIGIGESKWCQRKGNIWQEPQGKVVYNYSSKLIEWRITMTNLSETKITVENLEPMEVAYIRHVGPYKGDEALFRELFSKLMRWAGTRGLIHFPQTLMLAVYHDDPDLTDENALRLSCCITVPAGTEGGGEIGTMKLPGGLYAVGHFDIASEQFGEAWKGLCSLWLPQSGYQVDDRLSFEIYRNDPDQHPQHHHIVDICMPVRPL